MFLMVESQSQPSRRKWEADDVSSLRPLEGGETVTTSGSALGWAGGLSSWGCSSEQCLALEGAGHRPHWGL